MKKLGTVVGVLLLSGVSGHAQEITEEYHFEHTSAEAFFPKEAVQEKPKQPSSDLLQLEDRELNLLWSENFTVPNPSDTLTTEKGTWTRGSEDAQSDRWSIGESSRSSTYGKETQVPHL